MGWGATDGLLERVSDGYRANARPLSVLFEVTNRCNLGCVHCYHPDHEDHGELGLSEVCDLFDQLVRAGTIFLSLTGGEVLARSDFLEIVDAAVARGLVVKVLTNATLVTDEVADRFARAGVIEVSVSLYGADPESHDRVTEQPGSFARTMAGIARLRERGLHVVVKTPLLVHNERAARGVHELARLANIPCSFELAITHKTDGDPAPLELMLARPKMAELMSAPPFSEHLLAGDGDGPGPEPCNAGRSFCTIGPGGELKPCVMMPVPLGSLREQSFEDLWRDHPFLGRLRALTAAELSACGTCEVKGSCTRCPGIAMQRGQGIDGCDLSAREIARARVDARRRLRVVG